MKIVIMGCGRSGSILALLMSKAGHEVTMIDRNHDSLRRLGKFHTCKIVIGNGLDEDTLRKAELHQADVFISCTNGDNTNLMVAQMAREQFGVKRVGAKVNDPVRAEAYRQQEIFTVTPGTLVAGLMRDWLLGLEPRLITEYNRFYPELEDLMRE